MAATRRVIPGFGLSLGYTLFCVTPLVLVPLGAARPADDDALLASVPGGGGRPGRDRVVPLVVPGVCVCGGHQRGVRRRRRAGFGALPVPGPPFVHIRLTRRDTGESIEAAIPRERSREMELKRLDEVDLRARTARLFGGDYSI
jgi:hypothetical protein